MLKQRIITAAILIPVVLAILIYLPAPAFLIVTGLLALIGAWEWSNLMEVKSVLGRIFYLVLMACVFFAALFIPVTFIFTGAVLWWLIATVLIMFYPRGNQWWGKGVVVRGLMGVLTLTPCWAGINYIRNESDGLYSLLFLIVLICSADTAAYFVGKKWGKDKLAPLVSPGKSRQGVVGALVCAALIALIALWGFQFPYAIWPWVIVLSLVTVLFSIVGDLFESMMKRQVGLKDSGRILPGHGGLLDRIDSLTAAIPVFIFCGALLGLYLR